MSNIFKLRENKHYNLRHASQFLVDLIHSMSHGSESASYLGPKIWEQIPLEIKNINSQSLTKNLLNCQLMRTPKYSHVHVPT